MPKRNIFVRQENSFWRAEGKWGRFGLLGIFFTLITVLWTSIKPWEINQNNNITHEHSANLVDLGLWYGFLVSLVICLLLLIKWRKWSLPKTHLKKVNKERSEKSSSPYYWALIIFIVLFGAFLRWNLVNSSISWEEYRTLGGSSEKNSAIESLTFSNNWKGILWDYPSSDKSHLLSFAIKTSHSIWSSFSNVETSQFNEFSLRAPNFFASLFAILLIGMLLKEWGFGGAGILCSFLLAMHPWHIERGVLISPDGIMIFLILFNILLVTKTINDQSGSWHYWIMLVLNQLLIICLAPVGILIAIGFMICAMVLVIHKETHYTNRSFFINRIIASHALGLMAFSPIMFPNLLQISEWNTIQTYAYEYLGNTLDSISKALWGMPFYEPIEIENSTIYKNSISNSFVNNPILTTILILSSISAVVLGFIRTWLHKEGIAKILVTISLLATLSIFLSQIISKHPQHFFVTLLITPILIFLSIGLIQTLKIFRKKHVASVLIFIIFLFLQLSTYSENRKLTLNLPYSPQKEINNHLNQRIANSDKSINIVLYGFGGNLMKLYHPDSRVIKKTEELKRVINEANIEDQELLILVGYKYFNSLETQNKEALAFLDSNKMIHVSRKFIALDPMSQYEIFRLLPQKN